MVQKEVVSPYQFTILVILTTIGDAILILPTTVANEANRDAWISTILGLIFGLIIVRLFIKLGSFYPKLTIVQSMLKIFGKWIGSIVAVIFLGYIFLSVSLHIRELGDFITTQILIETPIEVIHIMFITVIILAVRYGFETIARASEFLFPFVCVFLIVLFIFVIPIVKIEWIRPILAGGIKPILRGSIAATAFPFMELVIFLMFFPYINKQNTIKKRFLIGATVGGVVLILVVLLCILVLGEAATIRNIYPTFALARSISIGNSIQRIEGLIAILWTITLYLKITLYTYALHLGLAQLFKLKGFRMLTLPIGMILFASTILVGPNITYYYKVIADYWIFYDITIAVLLPCILICVFLIQRKRNTS